MRKGSDLIGRVIIAYDTGEKLCRVLDLLFDDTANRLSGFLIDEGGLFRDARVIALEDVKAIGPDAIVVPAKSSVKGAKAHPEMRQILQKDNVLRGTHIMTTDGRDLGQMLDLFVDAETGLIEGYEVSGGLFADMYSGRSFVPAPDTISIGTDVAFVPPETALLMEEQVGGIRGAMLSATVQIQDAADNTGKALQSASEQAELALQGGNRQLSKSIADAIVTPEEQRDFVVGKTTQTDVLDANGLVLIASGIVVSKVDADLAESAGVLDQLYRAVGGSLTERANERLQLAMSETGDRLKTSTTGLNEQLQGASLAARQRLSGARGGTAASLTNSIVTPEQQIEFATDREAQWSVATPTGDVLVNAGQTVSRAIAQQAQDANILDELYRATGGKVSDELSTRTQQWFAGLTIDQALGRRIQQTVRTQNGLIVAAPGQIVDERILQRTREQHQELALLEAVGLTVGDAARSRTDAGFQNANARVESAAQEIGMQLQKGAEQLQTGAQSFWQQLQASYQRMQQRSTAVYEQRQVDRALGRPATRVVLDRHDNVILNVGELITHRAIAQAQQAGVLNILLSSVYTETPKLTTEDLRAPESGMAALPLAQNGGSSTESKPPVQAELVL
ncbi:MAG: PRC-barrel domain-containing protein [Kaiparowitsia implicata GSE-PSE-MK54-09C]|nr:PRC-barrel domain-containing protein [Kaiparowitsia implicata GSE-PSE-MK54-09C]